MDQFSNLFGIDVRTLRRWETAETTNRTQCFLFITSTYNKLNSLNYYKRIEFIDYLKKVSSNGGFNTLVSDLWRNR